MSAAAHAVHGSGSEPNRWSSVAHAFGPALRTDQVGSLREQERQSLNRVMLTSRVEHDSAARQSRCRSGGSARSSRGGGSGADEQASAADSDSVLRRQSAELERCTLQHRKSGTSVSSSHRSLLAPEVIARRVRPNTYPNSLHLL